jgi:hypothetical protein
MEIRHGTKGIMYPWEIKYRPAKAHAKSPVLSVGLAKKSRSFQIANVIKNTPNTSELYK